MKPMPSSIRIGPYDVPINFMPIGTVDAEKNFGSFHSESMEIRLRSVFASDQMVADTLLHECLHAIVSVHGMDIRKDGEERTVTVLATSLSALIKFNPDLISYLQDALSNGKRAVKK